MATNYIQSTHSEELSDMSQTYSLQSDKTELTQKMILTLGIVSYIVIIILIGNKNN